MVCRTGDRALVLRRDGIHVTRFELAGREDAIVKVRGVAVALAEVELAFLRRFGAVAKACAAVALACADSDELGLACVFDDGCDSEVKSPSGIRAALAEVLAANAVPLHVVCVDGLSN